MITEENLSLKTHTSTLNIVCGTGAANHNVYSALEGQTVFTRSIFPRFW